jgi:hypothetical protein
MRVVFIFVVLLVLLALALPATFAVRVWMDGGDTITRAQQSGALRGAPAGRLNVPEYMIAMGEFQETWRVRAQPCRTLAYLWADLTSEGGPTTLPVSHKLATSLMGEQRGASVRWQVRRFMVACQLEQRYDDRELLRMWLERAYFGREALGLEAASQSYFNKPSGALNSEESARLAALVRAPGLRSQPERWAERARVIQNRVAATAR